MTASATRTVLTAAALLTLTTLTACGGEGGTSTGTFPEYADPDADLNTSAQSGYREPANPVDLARRIPGCELAPNASAGDTDTEGNRSTSCDVYASAADREMGGATQVSVTTTAYPVTSGTLPTQPDDSRHVVAGERFYVVITGLSDGSFGVTAAQVARATGGTVVSPS